MNEHDDTQLDALDSSAMTWDEAEKDLRQLRTEITEVRKRHLIKEVQEKRRKNSYPYIMKCNLLITTMVMVSLYYFFTGLWYITLDFGILFASIAFMRMIIRGQIAAIDSVQRHKLRGLRLDELVEWITSLLDTNQSDRKKTPKETFDEIVNCYVQTM